jgi:DivIVA domain-containing protein
MNDEAFRLTPADIRTQPFRRTPIGYDVPAVEEFRQRVADEFERIMRERAALEERLAGSREQMKAYREREKALNDAVVMAQQVRADIEAGAKRDAELVLREARQKADELLADARNAEAAVRHDVEEAQRQFVAYVTAFRRLLDRQLAEVDALAEHERDGSPPA